MQAFAPRQQRELEARDLPNDQRKKELRVCRNLSDLPLECSRRRRSIRARVANFGAAGIWSGLIF